MAASVFFSFTPLVPAQDPFGDRLKGLVFETEDWSEPKDACCFDLPQDQSECDCEDKKEHRGGKAFATGDSRYIDFLVRTLETDPGGK